MLCTHKTASSASLVLEICHQFNNSFLHQFSSIFGGNCITLAKGFTNMGLPDPCLTSCRNMDPHLTNLYTSYKNADPTLHRVKPLPIQVLHRAQAISSLSAKAQATIDMAWIAYFYLLWPGEHCKAPENSPLMLADVTLTGFYLRGKS